MNLYEILGDKPLQQNKWTLTKPTVGNLSQLEVLGWFDKVGQNKVYLLRCNICTLDPELFGEGYFKTQKDSLKRAIPCGCAHAPRWSEEQRVVQCTRQSSANGYTFNGFCEDYSGSRTKISQTCPKHGEWRTGTVATLVNDGQGCPKCHFDKITASNYKPDHEMIASFFASGAFHPETVFKRSAKKTKNCNVAYWDVFCPECGSSGTSHHGSLQKGSRPCLCGRMRQTYAYIHTLHDCSEFPIALKFGIARSLKRRLKEQQTKSKFTLKEYGTWQFDSVEECRSAERECKETFVSGVVSKEDMRDGYTETTHLYNLESIIEIYERHGGNLIS